MFLRWLQYQYHRISARHRAYLAVVPVCIVAGMLWKVHEHQQQPPRYVSEGRIVVGGRMNLPEGNAFTEELNNFLGTQLEILRGAELMARARQQVQLEQPTLNGTAQIDATLLRGTSIITVQATGGNGDYTTHFLEALLQQFIESRRDRRIETTMAAMRQIREELPRVERQLAAQEEELFRFKENHNMGYWGRQSAEAGQLLAQLKMREANLRMQLNLAGAMQAEAVTRDREARLSALGALDDAAPPPVGADGRGSEILGQLRRELITRQVEREQLLTLYKPRHPRVVALDREIDKQSRLLELLTQESDAAYAQTVAGMRSELVSVTAAIADWERKALESTRTEAEFEKLQSTLDRTRELYARLLAGLQSIDIGKEVNVDIVQILQHATPARPLQSSLLGAAQRGLGLGLLGGLALLFGLARLDHRAYAVDEIHAAVKVDSVVEFPHLRDFDALVPDPRGDNMPAPFREGVRRLYASLGIQLQAREQSKVIFCVSTAPGEGKSTLSMNLARHAARAGRKTLLIDADLRRGHLAATLGLPAATPGFAELLEDEQTDLQAVVHPFPDSRLSLLARGNPGPHTIDRLGAWLTRERLDQLKQDYGLIIIDAAPLAPVADSFSFLALVDHVLLITRLRHTPLPLAERTAALVRREHADLRVVINGVRDSSGAYGYGGYYGRGHAGY